MAKKNQSDPVEIIGTIKAVSLKTKVDDVDRETKTLEIKIQLEDDLDYTQEIFSKLKTVARVTIDPVQKTLT